MACCGSINTMSPHGTITMAYQILGLPNGGTKDEVKIAYRKMAQKHHPDKNPGDPDAAERFKIIRVAFDCIKDAPPLQVEQPEHVFVFNSAPPPNNPMWEAQRNTTPEEIARQAQGAANGYGAYGNRYGHWGGAFGGGTTSL